MEGSVISSMSRGLHVDLEFILVFPNHELLNHEILVSHENIIVAEVPCFGSLTIDS